MNAATSNFFQLWQIPSSKVFFGTLKFGKDVGFISGSKFHPIVCSCREIQTSAYEIVSGGSYIPRPPSETTSDVEGYYRHSLFFSLCSEASHHKAAITAIVKCLLDWPEDDTLLAGNSPMRVETVGAFQKLPMVMPSNDLLSSALRKARRVSPTKGIANIAKRERNRGAKQLDALMKELAVPLRTYISNFPDKKYLHPYERSLVELTLGDGNYEEVLRRVDGLKKKIVSVGKEHASLCAKSTSKREAGERLNEGLKRLEDIFKHEKKAVDDLLDLTKTLRAMPVVDLQTPTLCLVGAPNVGKSSLVRVLSTGKPEICNYPFTTRGILMGHIVLNFKRFQVTDTPGLLTRHDDDRNNLEKLTLAVLSHLPTAVVFVHDLTGECGTSPPDQFITYKEMRERFSDHLWLDVVSKCDLLEQSPAISIPEGSGADHSDLLRYLRLGPEGALHVSVKTEKGLNELKEKVHNLLMSQSSKIGSDDESQSSDTVPS